MQAGKRHAPGDVVEDGVEGARGVQVAPQQQVAEAAVVVQRNVAAWCRHNIGAAYITCLNIGCTAHHFRVRTSGRAGARKRVHRQDMHTVDCDADLGCCES